METLVLLLMALAIICVCIVAICAIDAAMKAQGNRSYMGPIDRVLDFLTQIWRE